MKYRYSLIALFSILMGSSFYFGYTPLAVSGIFLSASLVAYFLYTKDKAAAKAGSWRVSENALHMVALCGGWPGALVAQERLRHKTKKMSFRIFCWLTILVNLGGLVWLHSPQGNMHLRNSVYQIENLAISNIHSEAAVSAVLLLTKFQHNESLYLR